MNVTKVRERVAAVEMGESKSPGITTYLARACIRMDCPEKSIPSSQPFVCCILRQLGQQEARPKPLLRSL